MAEEPRLHMLREQRLREEGVVHQINLTDRAIICRSPVGIDELTVFVAQGKVDGWPLC
jgi:hypothetical protein